MCLQSLVATFFLSTVLSAQVSVLTHHNDNARTGANLTETALNVSNVGARNFGKLAFRPVDGNIYAQPLVIAGARAANRASPTDLVIIATEHNSVYAFDASDTAPASRRAQVWHTGPAVLGRPLKSAGFYTALGADGCSDITSEIGITSTPVVGLTKSAVPVEGVIFAAAKSKAGNQFRYTLFALNLADGAVIARVPIEGEIPEAAAGVADGKASIRFSPRLQLNRPGLLLTNNILYIAFGGHCDTGDYHGWLFAYDVSRPDAPKQIGIWCSTPGAKTGGDEDRDVEGRAGIWMSGAGPAADAEGNVYFSTGNGTYNGSSDLGDSLIKARADSAGVRVQDWFTPPNEQVLKEADHDFGSTGAVLLPDSPLLLTGDKQGRIYLLDRTNLGRGRAPALRWFQVTREPFDEYAWSLHGSPVVWPRGNEMFVYMAGEESPVTQFRLTRGESAGEAGWKFNPDGPLHVSSVTAPLPAASRRSKDEPGEPVWMPGGFLAISANGADDRSGILWATMPYEGNANHLVTRGVLRAFDASDLSKHELWDSESTGNPNDRLGQFAKFCPPTVANGKVYVATFQQEIVTDRNEHIVDRKGDRAGLAIYGLKRMPPD